MNGMMSSCCVNIDMVNRFGHILQGRKNEFASSEKESGIFPWPTHNFNVCNEVAVFGFNCQVFCSQWVAKRTVHHQIFINVIRLSMDLVSEMMYRFFVHLRQCKQIRHRSFESEIKPVTKFGDRVKFHCCRLEHLFCVYIDKSKQSVWCKRENKVHISQYHLHLISSLFVRQIDFQVVFFHYIVLLVFLCFFINFFCWTKAHFVEPLIAPVLDFVCPSSWVSNPEWISRLHSYCFVCLKKTLICPSFQPSQNYSQEICQGSRRDFMFLAMPPYPTWGFATE